MIFFHILNYFLSNQSINILNHQKMKEIQIILELKLLCINPYTLQFYILYFTILHFFLLLHLVLEIYLIALK